MPHSWLVFATWQWQRRFLSRRPRTTRCMRVRRACSVMAAATTCLQAGHWNNSDRRAVIAFKDLDAIPEGATITSAKLHLHLSRENSPPATYTLYRLTSDWGEGSSKAPDSEGQGTNSENGDATWAHTFWPNRTWRDAGGDFTETSSAELNISLVGDYTFGSTSDMAGDVQLWLDQPPQNYGWILIGDESTLVTISPRAPDDSTAGKTITKITGPYWKSSTLLPDHHLIFPDRGLIPRWMAKATLFTRPRRAG